MTEEQNSMSIPYIVFESMLDRGDRQQKRMVAIIILLIVLLVASNLVWVYEWNQYDYVDSESIELDADDGGNANYIGRDGEIYNGEGQGDKNEDKNKEERLERN